MKTAEMVVGTPGRILDHLERRTIDLRNVRFLVVDEADKMFEMGFIEDVEKIISQTPRSRQTMLFSATMSGMVLNLVDKHLKSPQVVRDKILVDKSLLRQSYYEVPLYDKFSLLLHLLKNKTAELAIVFCGTRHEVDIISRNLKIQGIDVMAVHGGLSQNKRSFAVDSLKSSNISVLVATDVAARGLDINNISHIYNYDVPKTPEEYVHRIGRTARAGNKGEAITILTERDHDNFRRVLSDRTLQIYKEELPRFERVRFNVEERPERRGRFEGPRRGPPRMMGGRGPRPQQRGGQRESRGPSRGPRSGFGHSQEGSLSKSDKPRYREPHFGNAG
jgi:ATP-dependent RNA helicase DeaD